MKHTIWSLLKHTGQRDAVGERDEQRNKFSKLLRFCPMSRRLLRRFLHDYHK